MSFSNKRTILPGLLLSAVIASLAMTISHGGHAPVSALTLALLFGLLAGNLLPLAWSERLAGGIGFSKKNLLQWGIVLYGLRITFQQISAVGWQALLINLLVLSSTFLLAYWLGTRLLRIDAHTAMLIGAGSAICGSSAILATESVLKADAAKVAVAVSTVVIFGTCAMLLYPLLFEINQHRLWFADAHSFGMFTGSTMHDVGQVVAAGLQMDGAAADAAVITKMLRVMLLAPFLLILSLWTSRRQNQATASATAGAITIPWFALLFIGVATLNSLIQLPPVWIATTLQLDNFLLAMATAALGLATRLTAVRQAGLKPLLLAALLFAYLMLGGGLINQLVDRLL